MTVSTTTSSVSYNGDGTSTALAVPFYFLQNTHLQVIQANNNVSPPTTATLVLGTDYTVVGAGVESGGTLTLTVAAPLGYVTTISRNIPLTQLIHYVPNDPFPAATHEAALDQLTMALQQQSYTTAFAVTLPPNAIADGVSAVLPYPTGGLLLGWAADGSALVNLPPIGLGAGQITDVFVSGSAGIQASKLAYTPSVTGAATRTVLARLQDELSLLDFTGADPTGTNDSSTAITNWLAAIAASGRSGFVPAGTYKITQGFTITTPITIRGEKNAIFNNTNAALSTPIIHVTSAGNNRFAIEDISINSVALSNTSAHGIQIDGGNDFRVSGVNISGTYTGVYIPAGQVGATLRDVFVHNTTSHGFQIDAGNLIVSGCYAVNIGGHGFYFTGVSGGSGGITADSCTAVNSGGDGFYFLGNGTNSLGDIFVTNCINSYAPNGHGFHFDTFGKNILVSNCFSEAAGVNNSLVYVSLTHGFYFTTNNHRVTVTGCQGTFSGASGISMDCGYFSIVGGDYTSNNLAANGSEAGILIGTAGAVSNWTVVGCNTIPKTPADVNTQAYGVNIFSSGCTNGIVSACALSGTTGAVNNSSSGGSVRISQCPGYVNENKGQATMANGTATIAVNHGLNGVPTFVVATPNGSSIAQPWWISSINGTTFNITVASNVAAATVFGWEAKF